MIRKFIQCKNTKERLAMIESTKMEDWTEGELDTVMEISGLKLSSGASKEDKWQMLLLALSKKDVTTEREIASETKVFRDVNEEADEDAEEAEKVSDLKAYIDACKKDEKANA